MQSPREKDDVQLHEIERKDSRSSFENMESIGTLDQIETYGLHELGRSSTPEPCRSFTGEYGTVV